MRELERGTVALSSLDDQQSCPEKKESIMHNTLIIHTHTPSHTDPLLETNNTLGMDSIAPNSFGPDFVPSQPTAAVMPPPLDEHVTSAEWLHDFYDGVAEHAATSVGVPASPGPEEAGGGSEVAHSHTTVNSAGGSGILHAFRHWVSPTVVSSININGKPAACDVCRKAKVRCDKNSPCGRCEGLGLVCEITTNVGRQTAKIQKDSAKPSSKKRKTRKSKKRKTRK